jgi:hypothetical protein
MGAPTIVRISGLVMSMLNMEMVLDPAYGKKTLEKPWY